MEQEAAVQSTQVDFVSLLRRILSLGTGYADPPALGMARENTARCTHLQQSAVFAERR
jgi:hypothetical protein